MEQWMTCSEGGDGISRDYTSYILYIKKIIKISKKMYKTINNGS